jgi:hypothetical protein
MKINIKFKIDQRVKILPLNLEGRIREIYIFNSGVMFYVRYLYEMRMHEATFYEDELREVPKEGK